MWGALYHIPAGKFTRVLKIFGNPGGFSLVFDPERGAAGRGGACENRVFIDGKPVRFADLKMACE